MTTTGPRCLECGEPTARPKSICVNHQCASFGKTRAGFRTSRFLLAMLIGVMAGTCGTAILGTGYDSVRVCAAGWASTLIAYAGFFIVTRGKR